MNKTIFLLLLFFSLNIYSEIKLYFIDSKLSFIKRSKTEYIFNYRVKEFSIEKQEFLEESSCNSCDSPEFIAFAPENEWFFAIETDKKDKIDPLESLNQYFELRPSGRYQTKGKKEVRFFSLISQKRVEAKKESIVGIKIFQRDNNYSRTITLPPTEDFTILHALGVNSKGDTEKVDNIKLTSSCGVISYNSSSQFRFSFPLNKTKCTIYATLGSFSDEVDIIRKDSSQESLYQFDITFNDKPLDELKISYSTLKKGINVGYISKLKPEWRGENLKITEKDGVFKVKAVKKQKEYLLEMINISNNLKDTLKIVITD